MPSLHAGSELRARRPAPLSETTMRHDGIGACAQTAVSHAPLARFTDSPDSLGSSPRSRLTFETFFSWGQYTRPCRFQQSRMAAVHRDVQPAVIPPCRLQTHPQVTIPLAMSAASATSLSYRRKLQSASCCRWTNRPRLKDRCAHRLLGRRYAIPSGKSTQANSVTRSRADDAVRRS